MSVCFWFLFHLPVLMILLHTRMSSLFFRSTPLSLRLPLPGCQYNVEVIRPAMPKMIAKYTASTMFLLRDTPAFHAAVTGPWLCGPENPPAALQWVSANLAKTKEQDRLLDESTDWLIYAYAPRETVDPRRAMLRLLALCRHQDEASPLRSVRDLRGQHLPMLRTLRAQAHAMAATLVP